MARGKRCGKRCRAGLHRTRRSGGRRRVPRTGGLLTAALLGLGGTLLGKALAKK